MTTQHTFPIPCVRVGESVYAYRNCFSMPTVEMSAAPGVRYVLALAQGKPAGGNLLVTPKDARVDRDVPLVWSLAPAGIASAAMYATRMDVDVESIKVLKAGGVPAVREFSYAAVLTERAQIVPVVSPGKIDYLASAAVHKNGNAYDHVDSRLAFVGVAIQDGRVIGYASTGSFRLLAEKPDMEEYFSQKAKENGFFVNNKCKTGATLSADDAHDYVYGPMQAAIRSGLNEALQRAIQAATVDGVTRSLSATASAAPGHLFLGAPAPAAPPAALPAVPPAPPAPPAVLPAAAAAAPTGRATRYTRRQNAVWEEAQTLGAALPADPPAPPPTPSPTPAAAPNAPRKGPPMPPTPFTVAPAAAPGAPRKSAAHSDTETEDDDAPARDLGASLLAAGAGATPSAGHTDGALEAFLKRIADQASRGLPVRLPIPSGDDMASLVSGWTASFSASAAAAAAAMQTVSEPARALPQSIAAEAMRIAGIFPTSTAIGRDVTSSRLELTRYGDLQASIAREFRTPGDRIFNAIERSMTVAIVASSIALSYSRREPARFCSDTAVAQMRAFLEPHKDAIAKFTAAEASAIVEFVLARATAQAGASSFGSLVTSTGAASSASTGAASPATGAASSAAGAGSPAWKPVTCDVWIYVRREIRKISIVVRDNKAYKVSALLNAIKNNCRMPKANFALWERHGRDFASLHELRISQPKTFFARFLDPEEVDHKQYVEQELCKSASYAQTGVKRVREESSAASASKRFHGASDDEDLYK